MTANIVKIRGLSHGLDAMFILSPHGAMSSLDVQLNHNDKKNAVARYSLPLLER